MNRAPLPDAVPLEVHVSSGRVPLSAVSPASPFFLLHGGAGPADPKGERAALARDAVVRIASGVRLGSFEGADALRARVKEGLDARGLEGRMEAASVSELTALLAARRLESEPLFNAGLGAALQGDGVARVSAAFMESARALMTSVVNVQDVLHPSELAFHLQAERFGCLDALGATALARSLAVPLKSLLTPHRFDAWVALKRPGLQTQRHPDLGTHRPDARDAWPRATGKGTIGCVAIDASAALAALTSTGGVGNETPGRMGDTPTVAGNYCTKRVAVSCTGYGEQILSCAFAARLATRVDDGARLEDAMLRGIEEAFAEGFGLAAIAVAIDSASGEAVWAAGTTEGYFIWAGSAGGRDLTFGA